MTEEKGLTEDVADKIGHYVMLRGSTDLIDQLTSDQTLTAVKDAKIGLDEMKILLRYCDFFGILDKVRYLSISVRTLIDV